MKFKAGDIVQVSPLTGGSAEIFSRPPGASSWTEAIGFLRPGETALVIGAERSDCRNVQVLRGCTLGWVFGAFIERVPLNGHDDKGDEESKEYS
jgi:hypothetical protein